ncbi:LysE family translocator [Nitrogeniibacter mangrovi]|uniref:LysE family translocator n=1 Tax=Nitrogeniibacter mangrovi TaxID=2016596 RepID=A0A6C1B1M2_9RHOO|nr:LysE family translocator [Nitrogeniibacter mangrovi]QID16718.1 LysE family translocator [Nitrogeniibacter mangrovi]
MPDTPTLLSFLGTALILTLAPGPDNLMVLAHSLARGRRAGLGLALGCALGCMTHILWATLGVSAALAASPVAFSVLKLAGALYLAWLGVGALRAARRAPELRQVSGPARRWRNDVARGFLANAVNPKVALFFLAFMPQFVNPTAHDAALQMVVLGAVFMAQTVLVFGAIALTAGHIGAALRRHPRVAPWLDRLAGIVFLALAARLATSGPLR